MRDVITLLPDAASIAVLVFAGSVLTARSLAARDRQDLDGNREFVGLGAANIAAGFFQGFPVNGSDSRSFLAANSGGRSQAVGLTSAVLVLITLLVLTPLFQDVPDAALGAVVIAAAIPCRPRRAAQAWRVLPFHFVLAVVTLARRAGVRVLAHRGGVLVSLLEVLRGRCSAHGVRPVAVTLSWRDVEHYDDRKTLRGQGYRFDPPVLRQRGVFRDQDDASAEAAHSIRSVVVNAMPLCFDTPYWPSQPLAPDRRRAYSPSPAPYFGSESWPDRPGGPDRRGASPPVAEAVERGARAASDRLPAGRTTTTAADDLHGATVKTVCTRRPSRLRLDEEASPGTVSCPRAVPVGASGGGGDMETWRCGAGDDASRPAAHRAARAVALDESSPPSATRTVDPRSW